MGLAAGGEPGPMMQVIPWSNYTWRSYITSLEEQIANHKLQVEKLQEDLIQAHKDLEMAEKLGIADMPLPDDYGKRRL